MKEAYEHANKQHTSRIKNRKVCQGQLHHHHKTKQDNHKIIGWGMKMVLQDMDLKNPVWVRELGSTIKGLRVKVRGIRVSELGSGELGLGN